MSTYDIFPHARKRIHVVTLASLDKTVSHNNCTSGYSECIMCRVMCLYYQSGENTVCAQIRSTLSFNYNTPKVELKVVHSG